MSVTVTWAMTCTIVETLANNTGSAPTATRVVTHTDYNEGGTLNSGTTQPATTCASFLATLSSGALTVDLRALVGTNGAIIDGNGLKLQILRVKNLGANTLTIAEGAANGYAIGSVIVIQPGACEMVNFNDASPDIAAADKTLDLTGTGAQTSEWTMVMG